MLTKRVNWIKVSIQTTAENLKIQSFNVFLQNK